MKPQAFTLTETLVTVSVMALLTSLLLGGLKTSREAAARAQCLSNLRQVTQAMLAYAGENAMTFPPSYEENKPNWQFYLVRGRYLGTPDREKQLPEDQWRPEYFKVMGCPSQRFLAERKYGKAPYVPTYMMNFILGSPTKLRRLTSVLYPSQTCLLMEGGGPTASGNYHQVIYGGETDPGKRPALTHGKTANVSFCDGHIAALTLDQIPTDYRPANSPAWFFWYPEEYNP